MAAVLKTGRIGISMLEGLVTRHPAFHCSHTTIVQRCGIHTTPTLFWGYRKWEAKNKIVYPPQKEGEPPRLAEIHHCKRNLKYSQRRMWYIATFIKNMWIDEALAELQFVNKKGAQMVMEILLEAQEMAVKDHNVEFKSNLHLAESFATKGHYDHAVRYHGKGMFGVASIVYCHYFVKLKEGPPPKTKLITGHDKAKEYIEELKNRTIIHGL
ncbi:large ribosomal subunit protein uL22m-like [Saccoglossus kowalevskii]|uniref:Large ribosomal subunit protein uL22m n=1 Tax=Saccoglossus kowalevskii TaxID=10224 RepID=A0ABM0GU26_SACKO|nr:PREDICTED: 39S ribosomal protein L22, mitochondrial-like [Saccoglossus kowalevskii]